ncbi:MAG TPA: NAD(P)-dependent oxidoreductase [Thermoanaerobaculia bacterium]|nr:NAD(P)-dependent oxidoreductase [Thermoanaerobaculia bacterium]
MQIAFIGLGAMGYPMARHLATEHEVVVWNRTRATAERHAAENGTRVAADLKECAAASVILTMLPTSREVGEIAGLLIDSLRPGTLWIDATSGDPVESPRTAERLAARGVGFVDAPVSGGIVGAEAGTLSVMMGGTADEVARATAIVRPFAGKIIHAGPVGSGHAIKVITNSMMAAHVWIAAEGLLMAKKFGIDVKTALEATNAASSRSNASENLLPLRLVEGEWPLVFKLALHDKDIRIAAAMAHEQHLATPMLALTSQLFTAALHDLGDNADYIEVVKYAAKMSGESW